MSTSVKVEPGTSAAAVKTEDSKDALGYSEFQLVSSASHGFKTNVMRFKAPWDVNDPKNKDRKVDLESFARPVKLNRKDPNYVPRPPPVPQIDPATGKPQLDPATGKPFMVDPETGKVVGPGGDQKKKKYFQKKTKQVFQADKDVLALRRSERLPWVLEDDDGKERWEGNLEGKPGESNYVFLVVRGEGTQFDVVPCNRVYKFLPKASYDTLTMDEAEAEFARSLDPHERWLMRNRTAPAAGSSPSASTPGTTPLSGGARERLLAAGRPSPSMALPGTSSRFAVDRGQVGDEDGRRNEGGAEGDYEEVDYDEAEEFQDDEDNLFGDGGDDEETRELEERIKREMYASNKGHVEQAGASGDEDEDIDASSPKLTGTGRAIKKAIKRFDRANAAGFDSDEEENPYLSEPEEEEDEEDATESVASTQSAQPPAAQPAAQAQVPRAGSQQPPSRAETPSDRQSKKPSPAHSALRRSGSPSARAPGGRSASPGAGNAAVAMRATSPLRPGSRSASPAPARATSPAATVPAPAPTAASSSAKRKLERESTPEAKKPRVKKESSPAPSPPAPAAAATPPPTAAPTAARAPSGALVTETEVIELLSQRRLTTKEFLAHYKPRIKAEPKNKETIGALLKRVANLVDGVLVLKGA